MSEGDPRFAGDDPIAIFRRWMDEALEAATADAAETADAELDADGEAPLAEEA